MADYLNITKLSSLSSNIDIVSSTESWHAATLLSGTDLDLFLHCWTRQSCDSCLATTRPCAWCAISQTCVPNERFDFPFGILAPIEVENICPLAWRERWEMRARPFSCRCSTMTLMSVVIAVLSTLFGVVVLSMLLRLIIWGYGRWKKRPPGWWRVQRPKWTTRFLTKTASNGSGPRATIEDEERRPLLG